MDFHHVNPPEAFLRFQTFSVCDSSPTCQQSPASTAHDPGDTSFLHPHNTPGACYNAPHISGPISFHSIQKNQVQNQQ